MSFWGKSCLCALTATVLVAVNGCSPSDQSQTDEEQEPHYVLGKSRVNAMDYSGAVEAFQESLEVNPRSASAHFQLACLYDTKEADPAAAIYHYQEFLQLDPNADNAEVIKQRIYTCKQQLAADVLPLPSAPAAQQQLEKLIEQNRQLQSQVDQLNEVVRQWNAYYASQQAHLASLPVAPAATQPTPDDISTPPANFSPTPTPTPVIVPRPATAQSVKPKSRTHIVVAGETLAAIARKTGVSLTALEAANPSLNAKKMHVGQIVNLPVP